MVGGVSGLGLLVTLRCAAVCVGVVQVPDLTRLAPETFIP
ncbi:hypothetical protein LX88_005698 [Lentzea californiensis]|nr:hypothetical protein [Lentzea californiensis]